MPVTTCHRSEVLEAISSGVDCALLGLPAEIRNRIYRYVIDVETSEGNIIGNAVDIWFCKHDPPLLRTNKQIREEALRMFRRSNIFNLVLEYDDFHLLPRHQDKRLRSMKDKPTAHFRKLEISCHIHLSKRYTPSRPIDLARPSFLSQAKQVLTKIRKAGFRHDQIECVHPVFSPEAWKFTLKTDIDRFWDTSTIASKEVQADEMKAGKLRRRRQRLEKWLKKQSARAASQSRNRLDRFKDRKLRMMEAKELIKRAWALTALVNVGAELLASNNNY